MGKWLDLAASLEEQAEASAISANSANSSFAGPNGTNDTIGMDSLPAFVRIGLHRLRSMPRPRITNPEAWPEIVADAISIADDGWAARAISLGWEPLHLFGWEPSADPDPWDYSLAVVMEGWPIVGVAADFITLRKGNVSRPFRNRPRPSLSQFLWDL